MKPVDRSASAKCAAKRIAPALLPALLPAACTPPHCQIIYKSASSCIPCNSPNENMAEKSRQHRGLRYRRGQGH